MVRQISWVKHGLGLAAVELDKLPENRGCLVQLVKFNPLVHRVGLVDTARAENYRGEISRRKGLCIRTEGDADPRPVVAAFLDRPAE